MQLELELNALIFTTWTTLEGIQNKFVIKKRKRSDYFHLGRYTNRTHGRDPTTAQHGNFWLLGFPPGPFRSSLDNLDASDSSDLSMPMLSLVRTPVQHAADYSAIPEFKPSTLSSLPEAGLQVYATHPAKNLASAYDIKTRRPSRINYL